VTTDFDRFGSIFLNSIAPKYSGKKRDTQHAIIEEIAPIFGAMLDAFDVTSDLRIAHFSAQIAHESAGFATTAEYSTGDQYENRRDLGNIKPGDGQRFKGRGLIQLTGRANYRRFGTVVGLPLEDEPQLAEEPRISLRIACEFWRDLRLNEAADRDDLVAVTRRINGGLNGLAERSILLKAAKSAIAAIHAQAKGLSRPILYRGVSDPAVGELQSFLKKKGFPLALDNEFGAATELAVKMLQDRAGIVPDGIVGPATWSAASD
jgi:putative chitinase